MFDYVSYQVTEKYQELAIGDVEKKLGAIKTLMMKGHIGGKKGVYKAGLIGIFLLVACILTYYNQATLKTEGLFTHLFYIPIILASIWWGKKGVFVAVFLGALILTGHLLFLKGMPISGDVVRTIMFVVIGGVVGWLMEGIKKVEELY
jgi:ABC-type multidrug transport system permease subunit